MARHRETITNIFSYSLLAFFLALFLVAAFFDATPYATPFLAIALVFFFIGLKKERGLELERRWTIRKDFTVTLAALLGALLTFLLSTRIDLGMGLLGPVVGASGTALLYGFAAPISQNTRTVQRPSTAARLWE